MTVLELGCGHALPSCFLLQQKICTNFILLDYNEFVLHDVTLPNMKLNIPPQETIKVNFISGDWMDASHNLNQRVDCIIASETIYTKQHTHEMILFLLNHLKFDTGIAIIATKRYYFGCGGGTNELFALANELKVGDYKLDLDVVEVVDNGMGNIREIILARCVAS